MAPNDDKPSYTFLANNKAVSVDKIGEEKSATYPSKWFDEKKSKPILRRPKMNKGLDDVRKIIKGSIGQTLDVNAVIAYACFILEGIKETLDSSWTSYNQTIGSEGEITPLSLVKIEESEWTMSNDLKSVDATAEDDKWLMTLITGVYRVERATDDTYRRTLINTISNMARSHGMPTTHFPNLICSNNRNWINASEYKKLMALIDMFFFKFDQNDWAFLRTGTISSRFKDCAALLTYNYASSLMGLVHQGDLLLWIFERVLAEEAMRIFKEGEEYGSQYSYFPYQVDFGLCIRSAYSARMNPAIHCFGNIIGAMMTQVRSFNARMILQSNVTNVISNAQLVGFVFATRSERNIQFLRSTDKNLDQGVKDYGKEKPADEVDFDSDEEQNVKELSPPTNRDPVDWFNWYDQADGRPNKEMKKFFRQVQDSIQNARPGSIGEVCKGPLFLRDV